LACVSRFISLVILVFVAASGASPRRVPEPAAAHASLRAKIAASGSGTRHGYEYLLTKHWQANTCAR
jgi:hypothetical protein